jgi:hypothetical protein
MTVQLDGYKVSRTQQLEDLTTGLGTSLSALAEQVFLENPSSSTFRFSKLEQATRGSFVPGSKGAQFKGPDTPIITKEDADKRVSEAGVELKIGDQGIPDEALNILIERKREEVKRRAVIDAAPAGFWSGATQIGTGLAVSLADPIGIASAFVPVVGQARYAKLVANTSTALGRTGIRSGVGATEGLVGAALLEPVILLAAEAEQADYGMYDSFLNLTFGAVIGGGLHAGLGAVGDAIGRSNPQTKQDLIKSAVGQVMDDKPVDVGFVAKTTDLEKEVRLIRAQEQGFNTDEVLFHGTDQEIRAFDETKAGLKGANFGDAVYLTNSPEIASGYAIAFSKNEELNSIIEKIETARAEWVDAIVKFGKDSEEAKVKGGIRDALEDQRRNQMNRLNRFESATAGSNVIPAYVRGRFLDVDAKGGLWLSTHRKAVDDAKEGGFDGVIVRNVEDAATVSSTRLSDVTIVFDGRNIESVFSKFDNGVNTPAPKADATSPEASVAASREAQEFLDTAPEETVETVDSLTNDILTALDEQGIDSAAVRAEIDEINKSADLDAAGLREAVACMLGK